MIKGLGNVFGKIGSGSLRLVLGLATGMGGTRLLLSIGGALMIASFTFLLEAPLLFLGAILCRDVNYCVCRY